MSRDSPARGYLTTWLALLGLLAATFGLAHLRLGPFNTAVSLAIATAKAVLVAWVFMGLRRAPPLVLLFAVVALVALAMLLGLSGTDYATRLINRAPWVP